MKPLINQAAKISTHAALAAFSMLAIWCVSLTTAQAAIYKSVDARGQTTYSNTPSRNSVKVDIDEPANNTPTIANNAERPKSNAKTATPSSFPKVDKETQAMREGKRKDILAAELEAEKKALEDAKKAQAEGESNPETHRGADGKTYRDMPKFDSKMSKLNAEVATHENNIKMLQKELGGAQSASATPSNSNQVIGNNF